MSDTVSKNLGVITAYGMAVQGGYTGTKEQFYTLLASIGSFAVVTEMPTASTTSPASLLYMGVTTANYASSHLYLLDEEEGVYSWRDAGLLSARGQNIIILPPAVGTAALASLSVYTHVPSTNSVIYTLPAIVNTSIENTVLIQVQFNNNCISYTFQNTNGVTITPLTSPMISATTDVLFVCKWSNLLNNWQIMPIIYHA